MKQYRILSVVSIDDADSGLKASFDDKEDYIAQEHEVTIIAKYGHKRVLCLITLDVAECDDKYRPVYLAEEESQ